MKFIRRIWDRLRGRREVRDVLVHPEVPDIPMFLEEDGVTVTPVDNVVQVAARLAAESDGGPELACELIQAFEKSKKENG